MPTLHLYLLRQVVSVMALSLCVFIGVLLMGSALKDVLALLVNQQVGLGVILKVLGFQIPWLLSFALPLGFLAGVLLAFGRMSADQELVAVRAGGISLAAISWPILLFAVLTCGAAAWINTELAPHCRIASKQLAHGLLGKPVDLLLPGRYIRDFPGWTVYIDAKDGDVLKGLLLYGYDDKGKQIRYVEAESATYSMDSTNHSLSIHLINARFFLQSEEGAESESNGEATWEMISWGETTQKLDMGDVLGTELKPDLSEMTWRQLRGELSAAQELGLKDGPIIFQMHRQVAGSFACLCFALVGMPLGIRAHRRETSVGIAVALLVALVYYAFQAFAQSMEGSPSAQAHLLVWLPNFVFIGFGCWLFTRANRGCSA